MSSIAGLRRSQKNSPAWVWTSEARQEGQKRDAEYGEAKHAR